MAYTIKPLVWLVKDQESVKFHVKNDDYFGTMATLLNLLKQEIYKNNKSEAKVKATFANMEKDFMWLQKNYKITKKWNSTALRPWYLRAYAQKNHEQSWFFWA